MGSELRVWGVGFQVQGSRLGGGGQGLGFGVQRVGFGVQSLGFRVEGSGFRGCTEDSREAEVAELEALRLVDEHVRRLVEGFCY